MLAIPPSGASSNIALWRANSKPPIELVVADLERFYTTDIMTEDCTASRIFRETFQRKRLIGYVQIEINIREIFGR
jgi:hypothetical protein